MKSSKGSFVLLLLVVAVAAVALALAIMSTALARSACTGCSGCGGCYCSGSSCLGLGVGVLILAPLTFRTLTLGLRLGGLMGVASSSSFEGGAGDWGWGECGAGD
jgi:hypothetical protein